MSINYSNIDEMYKSMGITFDKDGEPILPNGEPNVLSNEEFESNEREFEKVLSEQYANSTSAKSYRTSNSSSIGIRNDNEDLNVAKHVVTTPEMFNRIVSNMSPIKRYLYQNQLYDIAQKMYRQPFMAFPYGPSANRYYDLNNHNTDRFKERGSPKMSRVINYGDVNRPNPCDFATLHPSKVKGALYPHPATEANITNREFPNYPAPHIYAIPEDFGFRRDMSPFYDYGADVVETKICDFPVEYNNIYSQLGVDVFREDFGGFVEEVKYAESIDTIATNIDFDFGYCPRDSAWIHNRAKWLKHRAYMRKFEAMPKVSDLKFDDEENKDSKSSTTKTTKKEGKRMKQSNTTPPNGYNIDGSPRTPIYVDTAMVEKIASELLALDAERKKNNKGTKNILEDDTPASNFPNYIIAKPSFLDPDLPNYCQEDYDEAFMKFWNNGGATASNDNIRKYISSTPVNPLAACDLVDKLYSALGLGLEKFCYSTCVNICLTMMHMVAPLRVIERAALDFTKRTDEAERAKLNMINNNNMPTHKHTCACGHNHVTNTAPAQNDSVGRTIYSAMDNGAQLSGNNGNPIDPEHAASRPNFMVRENGGSNSPIDPDAIVHPKFTVREDPETPEYSCNPIAPLSGSHPELATEETHVKLPRNFLLDSYRNPQKYMTPDNAPDYAYGPQPTTNTASGETVNPEQFNPGPSTYSPFNPAPAAPEVDPRYTSNRNGRMPAPTPAELLNINYNTQPHLFYYKPDKFLKEHPEGYNDPTLHPNQRIPKVNPVIGGTIDIEKCRPENANALSANPQANVNTVGEVPVNYGYARQPQPQGFMCNTNIPMSNAYMLQYMDPMAQMLSIQGGQPAINDWYCSHMNQNFQPQVNTAPVQQPQPQTQTQVNSNDPELAYSCSPIKKLRGYGYGTPENGTTPKNSQNPQPQVNTASGPQPQQPQPQTQVNVNNSQNPQPQMNTASGPQPQQTQPQANTTNSQNSQPQMNTASGPQPQQTQTQVNVNDSQDPQSQNPQPQVNTAPASQPQQPQPQVNAYNNGYAPMNNGYMPQNPQVNPAFGYMPQQPQPQVNMYNNGYAPMNNGYMPQNPQVNTAPAYQPQQPQPQTQVNSNDPELDYSCSPIKKLRGYGYYGTSSQNPQPQVNTAPAYQPQQPQPQVNMYNNGYAPMNNGYMPQNPQFNMYPGMPMNNMYVPQGMNPGCGKSLNPAMFMQIVGNEPYDLQMAKSDWNNSVGTFNRVYDSVIEVRRNCHPKEQESALSLLTGELNLAQMLRARAEQIFSMYNVSAPYLPDYGDIMTDLCHKHIESDIIWYDENESKKSSRTTNPAGETPEQTEAVRQKLSVDEQIERRNRRLGVVSFRPDAYKQYIG